MTNPSSQTSASSRAAIALVVVILLTGWALTYAAVDWIKLKNDTAANARFIRQVELVEADILRRFNQPLYALRATRGLYAASVEVTRDEFKSFVGARDISTEFPGVRGFGYAEKVRREDLDRFIAAQRRDGAPSFNVRTRGSEPELYIVKFLEPMTHSQAVLGLDWGSDPERLETIAMAISTGNATLSQPIVLLQAKNLGPGFLYILPVYQSGIQPVNYAQREAALRGFLYTPIVLAEIMEEVVKLSNGQLDFELLDGNSILGKERLFSSTGSGLFESETHFSTFRHLLIGGRLLTLRLGTTPQFATTELDNTSPMVVGFGGGLLSLLLAVVVWLQATGRIRAEALAQSMAADSERLARVVQHTANIVLITDANLNITWVNDGFTKSYGYKFNEALGHTPSKLLGSGKNEPGALHTLQQAMSTGQACRVEILNHTKSGQEIWVDLDVQPILDHQGKFNGFMEIGLDITSRKLTREALRKSNAFLDRAEKIAGVGSWEVDLQTQTLIWSEQMYHIYDLPLDKQFTPQESLELFGPEERQRISVVVREAIKEQKPWDLQLPLLTPKGRHIWVRSVGTVELEKGRAVRLVGALQDVSSQKTAEESLRSINTMMQSIVDNLPCGLSVFDGNLHMVMHNMEFRRLLDLPDKLFAGPVTTFESIIRYNAERGEYGPGDVDQLVAGIIERARQPQPHQFERVRNDRISLEVRGAPMPGGGFITTYMDISERKKVDRLKDEFISTVSHELRTPLTSIFGSLKLLVGGVAGPLPPDVMKLIKIASDNSERLIRLINDVLDLEKMQSQKVDYQMIVEPLAPLIEQAIEATHAYAQQYDVTVVFEDHLNPVQVTVDSDRIIQVLINLLSNAAKFSHAGGQVSVRLTKMEGVVRVSVIDHGPGIPDEFRSRIFERFTQADGSDRRQKGGSGLGLTICKNIIEAHHGHINFHSEAGAGAEFYFDLPLSA